MNEPSKWMVICFKTPLGWVDFQDLTGRHVIFQYVDNPLPSRIFSKDLQSGVSDIQFRPL